MGRCARVRGVCRGLCHVGGVPLRLSAGGNLPPSDLSRSNRCRWSIRSNSRGNGPWDSSGCRSGLSCRWVRRKPRQSALAASCAPCASPAQSRAITIPQHRGAGGWRRTTVGECGASQIATVARPSGLQRSFKPSGCLGWLCCWPSSRCMWQGRRAAKEGRTCALAERLLHPHHAAWGSEMTFRLGLAQSEKAYSWPT